MDGCRSDTLKIRFIFSTQLVLARLYRDKTHFWNRHAHITVPVCLRKFSGERVFLHRGKWHQVVEANSLQAVWIDPRILPSPKFYHLQILPVHRIHLLKLDSRLQNWWHWCLLKLSPYVLVSVWGNKNTLPPTYSWSASYFWDCVGILQEKHGRTSYWIALDRNGLVATFEYKYGPNRYQGTNSLGTSIMGSSFIYTPESSRPTL